MKHTYIGSGFNGELDVEPIDLCPKCGADEGECETYNIVQRRELVLI